MDIPNQCHVIGCAAGTGGNPELGKQAANENIEDITSLVSGADMVGLLP